MFDKLMFENLKLYEYFQRCRYEERKAQELRRKHAEDDGPNHEESSENGGQR